MTKGFRYRDAGVRVSYRRGLGIVAQGFVYRGTGVRISCGMGSGIVAKGVRIMAQRFRDRNQLEDSGLATQGFRDRYTWLH